MRLHWLDDQLTITDLSNQIKTTAPALPPMGRLSGGGYPEIIVQFMIPKRQPTHRIAAKTPKALM
jgi:hypothetical protein